MTPQEIREKRLAFPLTVKELAQRVGVSAQAIRQWERGARRPRPEYGRALEGVFSRRGNCRCTCHGGMPTVRGAAWSDEEEATLRRLVEAGWRPDAIVDELERVHGRTRTLSAVRLRTLRLGLTTWSAYSANQAATALGVTRHQIERWIRGDLLTAVRSIDADHGSATRWWRIKPTDLEAFVVRYAGVEFDRSTIRDPALRRVAEAAARGRAAG